MTLPMSPLIGHGLPAFQMCHFQVRLVLSSTNKQGFTHRCCKPLTQRPQVSYLLGLQVPLCQNLPEGAVPGTLTLSVLVTQMGLFLCKSWGILSGACWAIKLPLLFSLNGFAVWRFISPC